MKCKKILFVGDLRNAKNFGAIATTTALLQSIAEVAGKAKVRCLDRRYFYGRAPREGYPDYTIEYYPFGTVQQQPGLKGRIKRAIVNQLQVWGIWGRVVDLIDRIPCNWSQFEQVAQRVTEGSFLPYEKQCIEGSDLVVINAEGSIVNNIHNPHGKYRLGARYMLFIAYLAKVIYRKPTIIVNHIIDPDNSDIIDVIKRLYPRLDAVCVRDEISLRRLYEWGCTRAEYVPDALFGWNPDAEIKRFRGWDRVGLQRPLVCLGDSAATPHVTWDVERFYGDLVRRLQGLGMTVVMVDGNTSASSKLSRVCEDTGIVRITPFNTSFEELADVFRESAVFFSGRWHASILATLVGTRSILYGTDSHKAEVLHAMVSAHGRFHPIDQIHEKIDEVVESIQAAVVSRETTLRQLTEVAENFRANSKRYGQLVNELLAAQGEKSE